MSDYGSSFTRQIWTDLDHILLVYVGSAAEFALVPENHWLFYTGKLPAAPLDRLVSTFVWNRKVMQVPAEDMEALAKQIRGFHTPIEQRRSKEEGTPREITQGAYRAVGAMLIDYALLAERYLNGAAISGEDREQYYQDQRRFFEAMGIEGWEENWEEYAANRTEEVRDHLKRNEYTDQLFASYRKDLGAFRYHLLLQFMGHFLPDAIREKFGIVPRAWFRPLYALYPKLHGTPLAGLVHRLLLPKRVRLGLVGNHG